MSRYQHTHAEARIRAALGKMPYGGLEILREPSSRIGFRDGRPAAIDLADVARYLESLAELLGEVTQERDAEQEQLRRLRADVAAVRRVFGLPEKL